MLTEGLRIGASGEPWPTARHHCYPYPLSRAIDELYASAQDYDSVGRLADASLCREAAERLDDWGASFMDAFCQTPHLMDDDDGAVEE